MTAETAPKPEERVSEIAEIIRRDVYATRQYETDGELEGIEEAAAKIAALPASKTGEWITVDTAPLGLWLRTRREGEDGENICMARRMHPDEAVEWIEHGKYGRTTVTHHSFAAPTHWLCPFSPSSKGDAVGAETVRRDDVS